MKSVMKGTPRFVSGGGKNAYRENFSSIYHSYGILRRSTSQAFRRYFTTRRCRATELSAVLLRFYYTRAVHTRTKEYLKVNREREFSHRERLMNNGRAKRRDVISVIF